jgi:histidine ammonia-lyase
MDGSENLQMHTDCERVQDAYSFRCAPQVHGAVLESHNRLHEVVTIDLNSATDNPLIFPNPKNRGADEVISQGNFHGEILSLAGDAMSLACFELASISERRIDQILDHSRSGLPPFLAGNPGSESGMMIVQYAAAAALAEMRVYANPATAINIPTSANQEDHVSMGATAAWSLNQSVERLADVLACELIVAGEALEHLSAAPSKWVAVLVRNLRGVVQPLSGDRSLSEEMRKVAKILASGSWLSLIESELGMIPRL